MNTLTCRRLRWALLLLLFLSALPGQSQDGYQYVGQMAFNKFSTPGGIAVDQDTGRIFVADSSLHQVFMLAPDGLVLKKFGTSASTALGSFTAPYGVLVKNGKLWVTESNTNRVQVLDVASGSVMDSWGVTNASRYANTSSPLGMTWMSTGHIAMISEVFVKRFSPDGIQSAEMGGLGTGNGEFRGPREVAVDANGRYYASDLENRRVQVFSAAGQWLFSITGGGTLNNQFVPYGVTIKDNKLFVADNGNSAIKVYTLSGTYLYEIKTPAGVSMGTWSIAFDTQGRLLVIDPNIKGIRVFAPYWNDITPPKTVFTVSPQAGPSGWIRSSATLSLVATDYADGSGVRDIRYSVDGGPEVVVLGSRVTLSLTEGVHTVRYYATDLSNNFESLAVVTRKVDSGLPTVTASVSNRTVTLTASDSISGVAQLIVSIDGGPETAYTVPLVFDTNNHTVTYHAVDNAGNVSDTKTVELDGPKLTRIFISPSQVLGGGECTIRIELDSPAGNGGLEVPMGSEYAYLNPFTTFGRRGWTVTVPAGSAFYEERITLNDVPFEAVFSVWAGPSDNRVSASATVKPRLFRLVVSPSDIAAGTTALAKLVAVSTRDKSYTIALQSSSPNVTVPSSVTMRGSRTLVTFPVRVKASALSEAVTITATLGEQVASADVDVVAHELAYMEPSSDEVAAGGTVAITVYTTTPAPAGGTKIALSGGLTMPATVVVPAGELSATVIGKVPFGTPPSGQITVVATLGKQTIWCSVYTVAPTIRNVVFLSDRITGGVAAKGTVYFTGALSEPKLITFWPDKTAVANGSAQAPKAKDLVAFTLLTQPVGMETRVNIEVRGLGIISTTVTLLPVDVSSVKVARTTVAGGESVTATVTLSKVAQVDTTVYVTIGEGASAPQIISVKKGFSSSSFEVVTSPTAVKKTVLVVARSGDLLKYTKLTITP